MKTRSFLVLALVATIPFVTLAACNGDSSQTTDSGPQNGDSGGNKDVAQQNDGAPQNDAGPDAPDPCTTGLKFDNTLVPGYPNNVPQP